MMVKMWRPKNSIGTLLPVELINWFFCFGLIYYPRNNPRIGLSIIWTILIIVTYFISLHYVASFINNSNIQIEGESITSIMIAANILIYLCIVILMWIWNDRTRRIKFKALKIDETLEKLNIPVDYSSIFFYSIKLLLIWIIGIIFNIIINLSLLWHKIDILNNIFLVFVLQYTFQANTYFILYVSTAIVLMEERFKKINKLLLNCLEEKKTGQRVNVNSKWPPAQLSFNISGEFHKHMSTSQDTINDIIRIAKHLHLELCCLCNEYSKIFGIQIAMILASSIVFVTSSIFIFYTIMVVSVMNTTVKIFRAIFLIIRLSCFYLSLYVINSSSANTIIEWEKTGKIIHELEIVSNNKEHRRQIYQFSLQIMQNPLKFTAYGFVPLGYDFLHGFVGSATTYAIILIQMYDGRQK